MKAAQDIILKPVITERSMENIQMKKYTFKVANDANKVEIAKAVEELFGVKVAKVNTISMRGAEASGPYHGLSAGLEKGNRDPHRGLQDHRILRGHAVINPIPR